MKNFKKVLALVLVLATLMGFATVAGAEYKDEADISADYSEAIQVLELIETMEGYPDGTFGPKKTITREEAAKLIAIFDNKDSDISTYYTSINPFADEKGRWGESYVGYGYRAGIIAGMNATTYAPTANVTGTQFLKMALVTLGYDQEAEGFVGSSWAVNVLALAKKLGLTANLADGWKPEADLTREEAAQILLDTLKCETVEYGQEAKAYNFKPEPTYVKNADGTIKMEYNERVVDYWTFKGKIYMTVAGAVKTGKELYKDFGLEKGTSYDAFERPYTKWTKGDDSVEIMEAPKATFTTKFNACDLLVALGIKENDRDTDAHIQAVFVNGEKMATDKNNTKSLLNKGTWGKLTHGYSTCADMKAIKHGAQGTLTQVFEMGEAADGSKIYRVCSIDTWLAKVGSVTKKVTALDDHLRSDGAVKFAEVYGWEEGEGFLPNYCKTDASNPTEGRFDRAGQCKTLEDKKDANGKCTITYDDPEGLAKDDYVLITYSFKQKNGSDMGVQSADVVEGKEGRLTGHINGAVDNDPTETRVDSEYIKDAVHFHMGYSLSKGTAYGTYKFFYDAYGNVIGMTDAADAYGWTVVDKAWTTFPEGDATLNVKVYDLDAKLTTGTVKKFANVQAYLDDVDNEGVNVDKDSFAYTVALYLKDRTNGQSSEDFDNMYDKLLRVSADSEGKLTLKASDKVHTVTIGDNQAVRVTNGKPYIEFQNAKNAEFTQIQPAIRLTSETKILVHKMDGTYVSFDGYRNVESLIAHGCQYVMDDDDETVEVLYLYNDVYMTDSNFIAYVGTPDTDRTEEKNDETYYGLKVYVNGEEQIIYISDADKNTFNATFMKGFYEFQVVDVDGVTTAKVESGPRGAGFKEVEKNLYWSKTIHYMNSEYVEIRDDVTNAHKLYNFADDCKFYFINAEQTKVRATEEPLTIEKVLNAYDFSKTDIAAGAITEEHQGKAYIDFNSDDEVVAFYLILTPNY